LQTQPEYFTPQTAHEVIGQTFVSDWTLIDQKRISAFGRATDDPDPHHVDPDWAAQHSPSGKTISFGFLTVSLMTSMLYQVNRYELDGDPEHGFPLNFGFNKLRFVTPVPVDSRIRGHFTVKDVTERKPGQSQTTLECRVEIEGEQRPALVGEWLTLWIQPEERA
jgi:acyl dehydratase